MKAKLPRREWVNWLRLQFDWRLRYWLLRMTGARISFNPRDE